MEWKNGNKMFPEGYTPYEGVTLEDLECEDIERVAILSEEYARHMMIKQESLIWTPDGKHERIVSYDVFPEYKVDGVPLLNAYGAKMVKDWFQREGYGLNKNKGATTNAGFNYTGL